ncbi:hypothetical protein ACF0H5_012101 [Mactra antiquata]
MADAAYNLTKQEYTWSDANEMCTLATPNLNFSASGVTPDVDIPLDTDVWLGYVENMTPFEYFACAKKSDLKLNAANYITEGDPGKCWSACKNVAAVAVYDNECYCLQNISTDNLMKHKCNRGCPSHSNIVCGGGGHVSLYKTTYTGPIKANNSESNICLWYDITPTYSWGACETTYQILCYKDKAVLLYNGRNQIWYGSWINMTTLCFKDGGMPSNYNNAQSVVTNVTAQMWTGIIRNYVIYPVTDSPNVMTGKYGFVSDETSKLSFTNNVTVKKRALCIEGTIVTGGTSTNTIPTTDDNTNTIYTTTSSDTNEESSNTGVIVGVTLSIIVVIIVAIVLVVLWKRGIKLPFIQKDKPEEKKKQANNMTYHVSGLDNNIQDAFESSTTEYAEVDISRMSPGNKVTQNGNANRISDSSDEPHTYFVLQNNEDGPYDTTKTLHMRQEQDTYNPYNKISLEESSNYDHIGTRGVGHKDKTATDNPYNTTTLGYSGTNQGFTNSDFNRNDESEDTYNHIGDQTRQSGDIPLDNPYNATTLRNSVTNVHNNNASNKNDEIEDTYNHIDGQLGQTGGTFTDNDYDTLKK